MNCLGISSLTLYFGIPGRCYCVHGPLITAVWYQASGRSIYSATLVSCLYTLPSTIIAYVRNLLRLMSNLTITYENLLPCAFHASSKLQYDVLKLAVLKQIS